MWASVPRWIVDRGEVYYSTTGDVIPPAIWRVNQELASSGIKIEVETTDASGVQRTVVAYTTGDGRWQTTDLSRSTAPDAWVGTVPS